MNSVEDYLSEYEIGLILKKYIVHRNHVHEEKAKELSLLIFDTINKNTSTKLIYADRCLLSTAAMLHDIGYFINKRDHHKHSSYILQNEKMLDCLPASMRKELAVLCESHRKNDTIDFSQILEGRKLSIKKLIAVLRLADVVSDKHVKKISIEFIDHRFILNMSLSDQINETASNKFLYKLEQKSILLKELYQLETIYK